MKEVKWIKIAVDIFDDDKIKIIEAMPSGDTIIAIWFKLLTLAGKNNNNGVFMINDRIPYTDEMLATIFRRELTVVRLALDTFIDLGMIDIIDNVVTIPNWAKHQAVDALDKKREYDKEYHRKKRLEQKQQIECVSEEENRTMSYDKSFDSSYDTLISSSSSNDSFNSFNTLEELTEHQTDLIMRTWNSCECTQNIMSILPLSRRYNNIKLCCRSGFDQFIETIKSIDSMEWFKERLKDNNKIKFDWFVDPDTYIKVAEGNYNEKWESKKTDIERIMEA